MCQHTPSRFYTEEGGRKEGSWDTLGTPWDEEGGRKVVGTPWDEGYIHIIDNCNGREEPSASWIWDAVLLLLFLFFFYIIHLNFWSKWVSLECNLSYGGLPLPSPPPDLPI